MALLALAPGCPLTATQIQGAAGATPAPSPTASSAPTVLTTGPRAIRIVFKQSYPNGSFDASPSNGTPNVPGSGQQATRYFNPDGSLLAGSGPGTTSWLSSFEIGISGANNPAALNPNCAKFADTAESSATSNCAFGPVGSVLPVGCGAPNGLFRISEYDCIASSSQPTQPGYGSPGDGVYLRAVFNRALLGTGENIMAAIEYVAASYDPAPTNPAYCFQNGVPTPENCMDVVWKAYLKHSVGELVQPFLMLIPPNQNFVGSSTGTSGVTPQMRQFILPIASDPQLSVLQISRINSILDKAASGATCYNGGNPMSYSAPANSPLCAGVVLYSLTFYRI